jgi:hypothetical protein
VRENQSSGSQAARNVTHKYHGDLINLLTFFGGGGGEGDLKQQFLLLRVFAFFWWGGGDGGRCCKNILSLNMDLLHSSLHVFVLSHWMTIEKKSKNFHESLKTCP